MVARGQCLSILSKPLMLDLYSKRPVERIMHRSPLTVDISESIDSVLARIADGASDALISGFIVTDNGAYVGVATAQDLLVKSVEQARHRATALDSARCKAEEASLAKSAFLANLSHEIRTPLNGVLANLELLGLAAPDGEQAELIGSASVAAQALFEIIGDVLDLSKIEAGKLTVEMIELDLGAFLADIATMLSTQTEQRDIGFTSHFSPQALTKVRGDPTRLRQILMNLAGNALKFTRAGGLFFSLFRHQDEDGTPEWWFEIADTGIGFASHKAEQLFEAFAQEDESTTRKFGGTGLGLSICRQLTELMGGTIRADGLPEGGATFWCRFPFVEVAPAGELAVDIAGLSVIIVDQAHGRGERLAGVLLAGGARVTTVPDVAGALGLIGMSDGPAPDVLVFAASENCDGLEVLMDGLSGRPTVPVVITEITDIGLRRAAFHTGIRHWTVFSAGMDDLRLTVAAAAGRVRAVATKANRLDINQLAHDLAPAAAARLLVIDDTPMNQQVARRQLAKLGFACDLADNGQAGLDQAMAQRYDLIFSDIQMPVMDGHAFTRRLRDWEVASGSRRTPVIAMTANALGGDSEKCAEAGMDDYITKPVKIERLAEALTRWLSGITPPSTPAPKDAITQVIPAIPIDFAALTDQLGDDSPDSPREVIDMFLEFYPPLEQDLANAVTAMDRTAVRIAAHTAKGAALNTAATGLGATLQRMESLASQADWPELGALLDGARRDFHRIADFARTFDPSGWEARRAQA